MPLKKMLRLLGASLLFSGMVACAPGMGQPNMESALSALQSARGSLERAAHDKGGHRVRAIELVDQAISEVQMGIQVGAGR